MPRYGLPSCIRLISSLFALVGLALIGVGFGYGGLQAYGVYQRTGNAILATKDVLYYLAVGVVGVLLRRFGKGMALYMTLTGAIEEQLASTFDTEHVKSDIVSILDDRLADMQHDLQSVNRELRKAKSDSSGDSQFDFDSE
ncbi:MAG: hypothetical protein ABEJ55_06380 [Halanaeroarchaeum sp.]